MTSTLGTDQPSPGFIFDDLEGHQVAGRVPLETGLQLPYLDIDDPGFTWPTHPPVGLPPLTPLVPADRLSANHPPAPLQLKRNRNALRAQSDVDVPHATPASEPPPAAALPSRRSLRQARAAELQTVETFTQSLPTATAAQGSGSAPAKPAEEEVDPVALAADLEAALLEALDEAPEPEVPSARSLRLARAEALASGAVIDAPAAPSLVDSKYVSIIKSYGPFPALLPAPRDFRPLLALSVFGGFLGLDRFYAGKPGTGILKLATAGGAGIWWISDIIAILTGRTIDSKGRRFMGERKQLAMAWVLTGTLFAGLAVPVGAAVPPATAAVAAVHDALFPKPAPVPTWALLTEMRGSTDATSVQVTGDKLRFTYDFPGAAYAYLQKDGDPAAPIVSVLLSDVATRGVKDIDATPGTYRVAVRTDGTAWSVKVEEFGLRD